MKSAFSLKRVTDRLNLILSDAVCGAQMHEIKGHTVTLTPAEYELIMEIIGSWKLQIERLAKREK